MSESRVVSAYIEIKARKAQDFDSDARRMGQEAGREYSRAFEREADNASAGSKGRRIAEGKRAGAEIGDAAGKEAGRRTSKGITEGLARSRGKRVKEGEQVGSALGDGASRTFRERFTAGMRSTSTRAESILSSGIYKGINKGLRRGLLGAAGIGLVASSLSGLSTVIAGTVSAAISLSGAVGLLPGVLVAAGAGAVALKLGLFGVGEAIKNSGDPQAYAKSLEKLSPAAKGFTDAIVKMRPQLKGLQQAVQDGLFKGAGREITALGDRYLPILKRGLTETTQAFGRGRRAVAEYLDTAKTAGVVAGILDDTSVSAGRLSRTFKPFVSSLLDIASVGTTFLPGLTNALADAAERFGAFTARTKADGSMATYFQGGITAVGQLGEAVGAAGRIIAGIFRAGANADSSPLQTLAALLNDIGDTVNKPAFQAGLSHFFDAIASAGEGVGEKMGQLGDALVALEPTISRIVSGSGMALPSILDSISSAAISLAPTLNFLGGAFEAIAPHAGPLVIALLAVKGALLALTIPARIGIMLAVIEARILTMGTAAVATRIRLLGFAATLNGVGLTALAARVQILACTSAFALLGAAAAVIGVAVAARALGDFTGKAQVTTVSADKLAESLRSLGNGGDLGKTGLELFSEGMGPFKREAEDTSEALKRFGIDAYNALDKGWDARIGRVSRFGEAEAEFRKETEQLDSAFSQLAKNGSLGTATAAFEKFIQAGVDAGVPVASLKAAFPQFSAAIAASGGSVDNTTGKVKDLILSLGQLISKTDEYAGKTLGARGAARGYEAALDAAREAVKRNGESLAITTAKGRENSAALDAIAQSGIDLAKQTAGEGPNAQAKFRSSLLRTRQDLIAAAQRFGLSEGAAKRYAARILRIPSKASTRIATPGLDAAMARLGNLIAQSNRINGKVYTFTYRQVFESIGKQDAAMARRGRATGGFVEPIRRADGGLIDRRLGAPRQDNVPLMVSGGEFVMNAFATSQPGILALLRKINASNQMPQKLASGGKVPGRAAAGFNDLTASSPARVQRMTTIREPQPPDVATSTGLMAEIIATAVAAAIAREMRGLKVVLNDGVLAGSVSREVGRTW